MSARLPALKPRQVIKALEQAGFSIHHTTGSHHALRHAARLELRVTIAFHRKDLSTKTLHVIIKQAGMSVEEFLTLL